MGSPQETTTSKGGGRGGRGGSKAGVGGRKRKASTVQCKSEQVAGSPAQQPPSGSHGNQADDASWLGQAGAGPGPGGQDGHFNFLDGGQDFGALGRDSLGNGMLDMPGMEDLLHTDCEYMHAAHFPLLAPCGFFLCPPLHVELYSVIEAALTVQGAWTP